MLFNSLVVKFSTLRPLISDYVLWNLAFLRVYYIRSENIWLDGFLFDFLQKKTTDSWVRQYVILTGFFLSEKLIFDFIVRIYTDLLVNQLTYYSIIETTSISSTLNVILFLITTLFLILFVINIVL